MGAVRRLAAIGLVAGLAGCTGTGGVSGIVGGPVPDGSTTLPGATSTTVAGATTGPGAPTTGPGPGAPGPPAAPSSTAAPAGPATTAPAAGPGGMRLDGDNLGVTRVGAPFRQAVAAVTAVLGRPTGDPAPDTSCLGAEDETAWASFRLASSGGRVSGWISTSTSLATPAGATVGTTLAALRQAYGPRVQVPPPAPDSGTIFLIPEARLSGMLSGPAPTDTVTSLSNGTCEAR